jgi:alanyl-tRNA synthetase
MEYTDEQIKDMMQRESDRRVTEALQTQKAKLEAEKLAAVEAEAERVRKETLEKATLSAEELAQKQLEEKMKEITGKEAAISKKANLLTAKELLTEAGIPKTKYEKMLEVMVSDNAEMTTNTVNQFISVYNETKTEIESALRTELSKVPPPASGGGGAEITKDDFAKMPYAQKLDLKTTNPELYKTFMS